MISFRLTEEEYFKFRDLCFAHGIRSVSEMGRTAINMLLQQPARSTQEGLEGRVSELEARVQMLSMEIKRLERGPLASLELSEPMNARQT